MKQLYFGMMVLLVLSSCGEKSPKMGQLNAVPVDSRLKFEKICELDETINLLGNQVSNIEFVDNDHFYMITNAPSRVYLYNTKGEQLKEINKTGKGEGEYIQIGSFRVTDDTQYLWCNMSRRMHLYDKETKIINSFSKEKNAQDFIPYHDQLIFYNFSNTGDPILTVCTTKGDLLKNIDVATISHNLLNSIGGYPKILLKDSSVYYIHADELALYELNLNNYSTKSYPIEDDNFMINRNITDEQVSARYFNLADYLFNNSSVYGLFAYKNYFILVVGHGKALIEENRIKDDRNRYTAYYILDEHKKFKERIVFRLSEHKLISPISYKGELYTLLLENAGTDEEKYTLYKIDLIN